MSSFSCAHLSSRPYSLPEPCSSSPWSSPPANTSPPSPPPHPLAKALVPRAAPVPSTAEHRTTLLSSSASSDIVRAARSRCICVCATRGTTNPRCHRVRDSSTGRVSSNPANSSAYRSNRRPSLSVIRRATSAARFLTSTSSPKSSRTRARTPALSPPISSAIARAVAKPQRAPVSRRRRDSMPGV